MESANISTIPSTALFFRDFERANKRIGRDFVRKVSALCKQSPLIRRIMLDWMVFFKGWYCKVKTRPLSGLSAMSSTFHQKQLFAGSSLGISRSSKKKRRGDKAAYHDLLDPSNVEALYNGHSLFFCHHLLREEWWYRNMQLMHFIRVLLYHGVHAYLSWVFNYRSICDTHTHSPC